MIKVGTDFSGIGSPEAALRRLNLPHKNIFACEIDKFAKQSYLELNDTDTFYEDITTRNHSEVEQLDLYVAGFPCQAFSYAGKRKGFADETRGTLFFDVAEFIRVNQPNCFILENVRGLVSHDKGRTFQTITDILSNGGGSLNGQVGLDTIDNGLGYHVYYKILNTKNFGIPQNRERIFIIGFKNWREFRFPKEFSLDITLKDLLEDDVDVKYNLSDKAIKSIIENPKNLQKSNVDPNIASALQCPGHSAGVYKGANFITIHNLHPRCGDPKKGGTGHLSKTDGIAYCLDAANSIAVEWVADYRTDEGLRIRKDNNSPCLTASKNSEKELSRMPPIIKQNKIRRLTPLETWRLQGFTDEEFWKAQKVNSDTQLYKQAGNTITVNVMVELLKKIYLK
jgi:DNA (cytosine-5)-methyltransferase 1